MNPEIEKLRRLVATNVNPQASEVRPLLIKLDAIQTFVNAQAENEGLWFEPETAPESYLQEALRDLHRVIEE